LRKVSIVVAAAAALLCFAAVALAQTNTYTVSGKIASGGTKKKPKPVAVQFGYTVGTQEGTLASPVKTYKIHLDGVYGNADFVSKKCSAATLNAMSTPDDSTCPAASKVGTGSVDALVGTAGQAITGDTAKCHLDLRIYAGTKKSLTLFLSGKLGTCVSNIAQAIDAKFSTSPSPRSRRTSRSSARAPRASSSRRAAPASATSRSRSRPRRASRPSSPTRRASADLGTTPPQFRFTEGRAVFGPSLVRCWGTTPKGLNACPKDAAGSSRGR
jgi:hypothetical protein